MAFDGITIANIVKDLQDNLIDGRLSKIAQPEPDELLCTIKGKNGQQRLCLSASASLPLIYLTRDNKPSPMTAPNFCMLLRKYVQNARIVSISQPGLERIVIFELEHLDELGDLRRKKLIVEIMGKHSTSSSAMRTTKYWIVSSTFPVWSALSARFCPASRGSSLTPRKNSTRSLQTAPFLWNRSF